MRIFVLMLLASCAHSPQPPQMVEEPYPRVSVDIALEHIGQSYTFGCVEALKARGEKNIYPLCRQRGIQHQEAVKKVIESK